LPPASVVGDLVKEMAWFKSHPNPASSYFVIEPMSVKQIENVRVCDLQGKSQVVGMIPVDGGGKLLDVSGLLSGVYLVEISAEGKSATLKLVKP
jgi:hypothetical protein